MKILFVYKYLTLGGVETVLKARLTELPRQGIDAQAWFLMDGPGRALFDDVADRIRVGSTGSLAQHLLSNSYDHILSIDTAEILPVLQRCNQLSGLIMEFHTPYAECQAYLPDLRSFGVKKILVPSSFQADVARGMLPAEIQIAVVPNPLAQYFFRSLQQIESGTGRKIVAWIGRLDALKNWSGYLEVLEKLLQSGDDFDAWIMATPGARGAGKQLMLAAQQRGLLSRLRWFRNVPHTYLPNFLDAVRSSGGVVVSTTLGDSFGMTVAEAMARSCAVVVPDKGPFREYVQGGDQGLVYEQGNMLHAAARVRQLLHDPRLCARLGERARVRIRQRHHPVRAIRKLVHELQVSVEVDALKCTNPAALTFVEC